MMIRGLNSDPSAAPTAPEMGARLPVPDGRWHPGRDRLPICECCAEADAPPGVDLSLSGPPTRWRCWNCGASGEGEMPIEHRSPWTDRAPCRGWRLLWFRFWDRIDRAIGDAFAAFARWPLMRAQARFAREERRERWERENAPKSPVEFAYLGNISDNATGFRPLLGEPNTDAWRKGEALARQISAKVKQAECNHAAIGKESTEWPGLFRERCSCGASRLSWTAPDGTPLHKDWAPNNEVKP